MFCIADGNSVSKVSRLRRAWWWFSDIYPVTWLVWQVHRLACVFGWHNISCRGRSDHTVVAGKTVKH